MKIDDFPIGDIALLPSGVLFYYPKYTADNVMTAAKKAGAMGGTTISGRGLETEKVIKFLGISIVPEKDVILILAPDEIKNNIMNSIVEDCGLKTEGAGICFSLPVEDAVGIKQELNIK